MTAWLFGHEIRCQVGQMPHNLAKPNRRFYDHKKVRNKDVRRWLGLDQKEAVEQTESVKQAEKIAPVVKETPGQKLRREIERSRQQHQQQRRSGGMHV